MTYMPKLGINPGPGISEDTPRGIYFYPFHWAYSVKKDKEALPWADNAPYIQLFQYSTGAGLHDPNQIPLANAVAELKNYGITDEDIAAEKENHPSISTYGLLVWCLGKKYNDNKRVTILNKVLRNLGYNYILDNGKGWIAINEPTQGVVLNPTIINKVVTFNNYTRKKEQGMAEDAENFNGIDISIEVQDDEVMVRATAGGRELGHVLFVEEDEYLMPQDLEVEERFQGQGIAAAMYDYVKSKGYKIRRSGQQTDAGAGFWGKHRPEQNVWENFADGKNPQDKGDSKRHGINTKASVSSLRKTAKQGGRKGQLAHWLANMKAGRAKAKKK
jgi:GNAT superfamily N-acetyltransferase